MSHGYRKGEDNKDIEIFTIKLQMKRISIFRIRDSHPKTSHLEGRIESNHSASY